MAQMDDNIARQVVGDMKKNVRDYSKEKYAMMVTLLAKSSSPVMRELLKDLYASISDSKNKKVQGQAGRGAPVHALLHEAGRPG